MVEGVWEMSQLSQSDYETLWQRGFGATGDRFDVSPLALCWSLNHAWWVDKKKKANFTKAGLGRLARWNPIGLDSLYPLNMRVLSIDGNGQSYKLLFVYLDHQPPLNPTLSLARFNTDPFSHFEKNARQLFICPKSDEWHLNLMIPSSLQDLLLDGQTVVIKPTTVAPPDYFYSGWELGNG